MDILKVVGIGITGAIVANLVKNGKSDFSIFVTIATGVIILAFIMTSLTNVIIEFSEIAELSGIDDALFGSILKIIGIGYITEYGASICSDMATESLAKKIQLAGKITIFIMALPIIKRLLELIGSIV